MFMLSKRWARAFYISTYVAIIVGIGLALLVTGYDLVEQTLALAHGGGRYFYIFILVGAYVATVLSRSSTLTDNRVCYPASLHWQDYSQSERLYRQYRNGTCQSRKSTCRT